MFGKDKEAAQSRASRLNHQSILRDFASLLFLRQKIALHADAGCPSLRMLLIQPSFPSVEQIPEAIPAGGRFLGLVAQW